MKPIRYIPSKDYKTYTAHEMLEDVLTQIQDLREEFASTLDAMEDMITGAMKGDVPGLLPHYSTILLTTVSDINAKRYFKQKSAAVYCR